MDQSKNIEKRILWVAERLFLEKGFSGTSTTEIAKAVGCNQALIHYYFRTKEKLFWDVFSPKMEQIVEYLDAPLEEDGDFFQRIGNIIEFYFGMLSLDERLAPFIVGELLMNPTRWDFFRSHFLRSESRSEAYGKFDQMVQDEIARGTIRDVQTIDIVLNIMSLCLSSFIVAPKGYASSECDISERKEYLEHRKKDVTELVINGLRKQ
jgi:AcrR family transcriptional regulator